MERVEKSKCRYIVLIGGRGSGKSRNVCSLLLKRAIIEGADVLNGREFMKSIKGSVHKLYLKLAKELEVEDYITHTKTDITTNSDGELTFAGFSRNPDAIKSAEGNKYSWMEEAQTSSDDTLKDLLPTIREAGSQLFFTGNPGSKQDPFSKRFIVPYLNDLMRQGWYEDELHLIIKVNWRDNPWHGELEKERLFDYHNKPRALYDHIWEGDFNDSVENPLIMSHWFDSCIDAHEVLGFKANGLKIAAGDPADLGPDSHGYAMRHGSVFLHCEESVVGDANEGCDWATGLANQHGVGHYSWDCDGLGSALNRQVSESFKGQRVQISQFKGSKGVDFPNKIFQPAEAGLVFDQRKNIDALKNRRAQYYAELRDRVYRTFLAVTKKEYHDPDKMISFSSSMPGLEKLRSELCTMPVKPNPNGLFELWTKEDMRTKFKVHSPNLADSVMMCLRIIVDQRQEKKYVKKRSKIGLRTHR
jgi:phage terminase large subunit